MSQSVLKNYWPSLLLSSALIAGLVVCLKRIDCLAIEEVNTVIIILFGSATSCLLLTFLWLGQHKHLKRPWPNQGIAVGRDILSMHPRGRADSMETHDTNQLATGTIATITIEQPPTYEDALTNTKPLNWWISSENKSHQNVVCDCDVVSRITNKSSRDLIRGDQIGKGPQQPQGNIQSSSTNERKTSYIQLDVGQLVLSSSPPKYCDLHFNNYLMQSTPIEKFSAQERSRLNPAVVASHQ